MIETARPPEFRPTAGPFPTFLALARKLGGLFTAILKRIPYYRYALVAILLFTVATLVLSWRESERTRPLREFHAQLAKQMITAHNLSVAFRNPKVPPLLKRWIFPDRVEADDTFSLIFWNTAINRENMELAARVRNIHDLYFPNQEFDPQDLKPFTSHTEIQGLSFRGCRLTDTQFAEILQIFPKLKWVYLEDVPLTDKSADLLLSRKIALRAPPTKIKFSPSALNRLKAARLTAQ